MSILPISRTDRLILAIDGKELAALQQLITKWKVPHEGALLKLGIKIFQQHEIKDAQILKIEDTLSLYHTAYGGKKS